jgi:hypothetical protein
MSGSPPSRELAMYVVGESDLGRYTSDSMRISVGGRFVSMFVPFAGLAYAKKADPTTATGPPAGSRPRPQGASDSGLSLVTRQCLAMVLDYAKRFGWSVHIIDVTQQSVPESEIVASLGPDVTLPVLVRPDGARLQGDEEFTPGRIRRFLSGP